MARGDKIDEMDDCLYALEGDSRAARRESVKEDKDDSRAAPDPQNTSKQSSQISGAIDKSGLSRQSHYKSQ